MSPFFAFLLWARIPCVHRGLGFLDLQLRILLGVRNQLEKLPSLVDVPLPRIGGEVGEITVCGDVHGQFYDLLNIFEMNGLPSEDNPYIFNGDFVDRGSFSVEVAITLLTLRLMYPTGLYLTRGNHESQSCNAMYGFEGEVCHKYDPEIMSYFADVFNLLPLATCIESKVFVVHGGLFDKDGVTLDDIRKIDRYREPPLQGLMCDMLWYEPQQSVVSGRGAALIVAVVRVGDAFVCLTLVPSWGLPATGRILTTPTAAPRPSAACRVCSAQTLRRTSSRPMAWSSWCDRTRSRPRGMR